MLSPAAPDTERADVSSAADDEQRELCIIYHVNIFTTSALWEKKKKENLLY